jgi:ABC-type amino acid transport substrate-binding protein
MTTNDNSSEDSHLNKALEHLNSVLVTGETLDAWAIQRRLFALTNRRILIAATSGRFIKIKRGLLGGFDMTDFRWQDLGDAKIKVGIFGADIFMKIFGSTDLAISKDANQVLVLPGFRKTQAEKIYRLAQAQDQSWREKRRIRELEELRAKSGGVTIGSNMGTQQTANSSEDAATKLQQAKQMLDNKLITDSEFESIKAKIISGL